MTDHKPQSSDDIGDAAWAYNRWPTIGLFTGGSLSAILAIMFPPFGWLKLLALAVGGAIGGCILGFITARIFYGSQIDERREDDNGN